MELKTFEKVCAGYICAVCVQQSKWAGHRCLQNLNGRRGLFGQAIAMLKVPAFIAASMLNLWAGIWLALETKQLKLKIGVWMLFGFASELYAVLLFYVFRMYTDHKK